MTWKPYLLLFALAAPPLVAQRTALPPEAVESQPRMRLFLKDGTFQLVFSYRVDGNIVHYRSAERGGADEDVPLALVDLPATERWARSHGPGASTDPQRPVLSPQLAKEEADRASRTPEVAPGLRLPEEVAVLALDTFRGTPELVPLAQQGSDLNRETAHTVLKFEINPSSSPHRIADVPGTAADVQLHVAEPVFYVRIGTDKEEHEASGNALVVDTHGAVGRETPAVSSADSTYVLERIDVRADLRQLDSFRIAQLGTGHPQRDVIELKHEDLPGGHWLKLSPAEPLLFGEYALVEILNDREVNLAAWDFGIHPDAKENSEAQRPEHRTAPTLQKR